MAVAPRPEVDYSLWTESLLPRRQPAMVRFADWQNFPLPPGPPLFRLYLHLDFRLHALKGCMKGHYAVSVSANWRVTFRFEEGHAVDADYIDYH